MNERNRRPGEGDGSECLCRKDTRSLTFFRAAMQDAERVDLDDGRVFHVLNNPHFAPWQDNGICERPRRQTRFRRRGNVVFLRKPAVAYRTLCRDGGWALQVVPRRARPTEVAFTRDEGLFGALIEHCMGAHFRPVLPPVRQGAS